jgi:hypothetical protein
MEVLPALQMPVDFVLDWQHASIPKTNRKLDITLFFIKRFCDLRCK